MKKKLLGLSLIFLFFVIFFVWFRGELLQYIPFTEEYDNRRYKNVVSYSSIDFSNENRDEEWSISLKKNYGWEPVKSIALKGSKAIEHINREFGENLMFIVYQREEYFQYNIGEYCRIRIPVEAGRVLVNGK